MEQRFWAQVQKTDGCWLWQGRKFGGYGQITRYEGGRTFASTHRYSWELHFGPIPDGLWVLHACDVPSCVRPDHLWLGTAADNVADMIAKGRAGFGGGRGEQCALSRLTEASVREIRRRYAEGGCSIKGLAREFGVGTSTMKAVLRGRTWSHVGGPLACPAPQSQPTKLTAADVLAIRARYAAGGVKQFELAREFGVTAPLISQIVLRKAWKHLR